MDRSGMTPHMRLPDKLPVPIRYFDESLGSVEIATRPATPDIHAVTGRMLGTTLPQSRLLFRRSPVAFLRSSRLD